MRWVFVVSLFSIFADSLNAQPVKVSANGRYLLTLDNQPFFWLGDTAWELFHRLNREEAVEYLKNRAR